jgi:chromosome segregation ATPase
MNLPTLLGIVVGVVVTAFLVLMIVGITLLVRRSRRQAIAPAPGRTDAGVALVQADDAVKDGADELAFAVAQFGEDRTREFSNVLASAKADLTRAFRLQQQLDDSEPDSDQQRAEWTHQIRALADGARTSVTTIAASFDDLRRTEAGAPDTLKVLRASLAALATRRAASASTVADLRTKYVDSAISTVGANLDSADTALAAGSKAADAADAALSSSTVPNVTDELKAVQDAVGAATQQLDAIDHRRDELASAEKSIAELVTESTGAIAAAKKLRDAPPDPDSATAVNDAIAALQSRLATAAKPGRRDPAAQLDDLVDASDKLDLAVAAAQNQQRRLDGARAALGGAMVSAKSQIAAVTDYIDGHRADVGADARTRLAEAQRQLMLAQNESDPVNALDIARRAQTDARDADALAKYSGGYGLHAPYAQ